MRLDTRAQIALGLRSLPRNPVPRAVRLLRNAFLAVVACALSLGCGDSVKLYPIQGTIERLDGQALSGGRIHTRSRETGLEAQGLVEPNGRFSLRTRGHGPGLVEGTHDVIVTQRMMMEGEESHGHAVAVDSRYGNFDTSGLTIVVDPNQPTGDIVLQLE